MSLQLVDSHAHLCSEAFASDLAQVIQTARDSGIQWALNVADDIVSSRAVAAAASSQPFLPAAVGVHPHAARTWDGEAEQELRRLLALPGVVALGEIGLDYHYDFSPRERQKEVFGLQLKIARSLHVPVVVHNRTADEDLMELLQRWAPLPGVLHCFWSTLTVAREAIACGLYLGVGGAITFRNANELREVIKKIPLEHLLLETDAPYLAPVPKRGKRNEPAFLVKTAAALAQLHGKSVSYVAEVTTANAKRLFWDE